MVILLHKVPYYCSFRSSVPVSGIVYGYRYKQHIHARYCLSILVSKSGLLCHGDLCLGETVIWCPVYWSGAWYQITTTIIWMVCMSPLSHALSTRYSWHNNLWLSGGVCWCTVRPVMMAYSRISIRDVIIRPPFATYVQLQFITLFKHKVLPL